MANFTSIGGNPSVPAAVQPNSITDAMLVQTGGVLDTLDETRSILFDSVGESQVESFAVVEGTAVSKRFPIQLRAGVEYKMKFDTNKSNTNNFAVYYDQDDPVFYPCNTTNTVTLDRDVDSVAIWCNGSQVGTGTATFSFVSEGSLEADIDTFGSILLNDVYTMEVSFVAGTSAGYRLDVPFKKGDVVALSLKTPTIMSNKVAYYYRANGSGILIGTARSYHDYKFTCPVDVEAFSVYISGSNYPTDATFTFVVRRVPKAAIKPKTIRINATDNNLYATVKTITDASVYNPYVIELEPGTYTLEDEFTSAEISSATYSTDGWCGLRLTDGISLVGLGSGPENIVISCDIDTSYSNAIRNAISTINICGFANLKNLTVRANNIRYAVHDDFAYTADSTSNIEDCIFELSNPTSSSTYVYAYGCGTNSGRTLNIDRCKFDKSLLVHTSTNFSQPSVVNVSNSEAENFAFGDYGSVVVCRFNMFDCKAKFVYLTTNHSNGQQISLSCVGMHGVQVSTPVGYVYDSGDCVAASPDTMTAGTPVKMAGGAVSETSDIDLVYGIVVGTFGGKMYVQKDGRISNNILGVSNLAVGDYLGIVDGELAVVADKSDAIAVADSTDSNGLVYARLLH